MNAIAPEPLKGFEPKLMFPYSDEELISFSRSWVHRSRSQKCFTAETYWSKLPKRYFFQFYQVKEKVKVNVDLHSALSWSYL